MEPSDKDIQEYLNSVGQRRIDEDIQNKLREILKCGVCYDVPVVKDTKIRTCEQGHHFCTDCFKKLRHCGICRGQFHFGRNFVVEEIINQLGPSFGLTKCEMPAPESPVPLISGIYSCLHRCGSQIRALHMLHHIRAAHQDNLVDEVRSNPYLKTFNCKYDISFGLDQFFVSSFQISDMGLFTVVIYMDGTHLVGSTHMLAKLQDIQEFQCKLSIKVDKCGYSNEFSVSDCDLFDYNYDKDYVSKSKKCLKMDMNYLRELADDGTKIQVFFSVWKRAATPVKADGEGGYTQLKILPEDAAVLVKNDRRQRRNRQRNVRKKKTRQALKSDKSTEFFLNKFRRLAIF